MAQESRYALCTSRIEILDVDTLATQRKPRAFGAEFDIPIATLELRWVYITILSLCSALHATATGYSIRVA